MLIEVAAADKQIFSKLEACCCLWLHAEWTIFIMLKGDATECILNELQFAALCSKTVQQQT